jgi:hypothetical protein
MRATICRQYYKTQTTGTLTVYDEETGEEVFKCRTLELAWLDNASNVSCIPEGFYDVVPRTSPKYGNHLHISEVPNRSLILIHYGNYAGSMNPNTGRSDIRGCVLVGEKLIDINGDSIADITNSKKTMSKLMKSAPDGFVLEVTQ